MVHRHLTFCDQMIASLDQGLRTVFGRPASTGRENPAANEQTAALSNRDRQSAGRLMRVNHTGEVCAQALYQGQALTARNPAVRDKLEQASAEENDHLHWCSQRLDELDARKSLLNPLCYAGSFVIGAMSGALGDRWSLGFLAETERQVVEHLDDHLSRLPDADTESRAILEQMKHDEAHHATTAVEAGAMSLPAPVRNMMRAASRLMTRTTYWI